MAMEITETRAVEFEKLEGTSIRILQDYLDGKRQGGDDVVTARVVLNVVKGNRQTDTARQAMKYGMVHDMEDPKIRRKYVEATQPDIKKLLK